MNKKQIFFYLLTVIMLIFFVADHMNYTKNNFDVIGFVFVCNDDICEISHKKANGEIKYTEKIDIKKIESFSTNLEKIPRTNGEGLVIYANCKDGTSFRLSPVFVRPSRYVKEELIDPLNNAIKEEPISINIHFPY